MVVQRKNAVFFCISLNSNTKCMSTCGKKRELLILSRIYIKADIIIDFHLLIISLGTHKTQNLRFSGSPEYSFECVFFLICH